MEKQTTDLMAGEGRDEKESAVEIFGAALKAVDPYACVKGHAGSVKSVFEGGGFRRVLVIGFGKAAYPMARAFTDYTGDMVDSGILITKYGHAASFSLPHHVHIREAGHPIPDGNGYRATREIIRLLREADPRTFVVCLISGGGSALLVAPYGAISLSEKQEVTRLLLARGADINEVNSVRKHVSSVKGGRLGALISPGKAVSLILSDVIGDRLDVIASGPTAPDRTTYRDAHGVLTKYRMVDETAESIRRLLGEGMEGRAPETPKPGDPIFAGIENLIIGNNRMATEAARLKAEHLGFQTTVTSSAVEGEAKTVAREIAGRAKDIYAALKSGGGGRVCLVSGGETTVTVTGKGKGGRNMELALAFALEIEGTGGITLLSAGTDGTDGPTDAAGALVDGTTAAIARTRGFAPEAYLKRNDSYEFFSKMDGLFITGPTGTNVMDLQIVLITVPPVSRE